ncbi:MAG: tRNA-dihydrouridine synthase [bacterium]
MNINSGFWKKIKEQAVAEQRPIMVLAPMANVTDAAFRRIIAKYGKPDVTWTEFVSADGLCSPAGKPALLRDLVYGETERPIIAQLFSSHPDKMREAAALVAELGFDGIDINMGCPDKSIEKQGAGAAHIKDPARAKEVIAAAMEGARAGMLKNAENKKNAKKLDANTQPVNTQPIPISVKTRIGYSKNELETWLPELLSTGIAALTIHCRTRKEMSKVPARWEHVKRAVEIRDSLKVSTLILGNGDALDWADGEAKAHATGADGIMFGRAIFGNPWLFNKVRPDISILERLRVMVEHTEAFEELLGGFKNFAIMKKHYKAYVHGWDGAKELRMRLMAAETAKDVKTIVSEYVAK